MVSPFKPHIITLGVEVISRSKKFYEKGLGLQPSSASQDDIVFYPCGGIVLALYPREKLAKDATVIAKGSGFSGLTLSHNARSEKDVDAILKKAETAGAKILKPAQKVFWGGYSGYFKDPDGHLWEVAYNPYFEFDGQGNLKLSA